MAHHRYQTEGIVIERFPRGESNIVYVMLTKDLGLVHAVAQGARSERSKLRPHLQLSAHARVDLIRGKETWRLVDAEEITRMRSEIVWDTFRPSMRALRFVRRLVHGERKEKDLFADARAFITFLHSKNQNARVVHAAEIAFAMRTLAHLGYGGEDEQWRVVAERDFSQALIDTIARDLPFYTRQVNNRLQETHL